MAVKKIYKQDGNQSMKMRTWAHVLSSLILAISLFPVFNWGAVIILVSGVLIDIDHYFWYIYKYKKFNLIDCYIYFLVDVPNKNFEDALGCLLIFHTAEFLMLMVVLSFYSTYSFIFTIGLLLHYALDVIYHITVPKRVIANHSLFWWILKNKQKA